MAGVLLLLSLATWALASPVGSSADEDYHLASIWCAQGDRDGLCEPGDDDDQRRVPVAFNVARCYAFAPDVSGGCQGGVVASREHVLESTARGQYGSTANYYPPVFFRVLSTASTADIQGSVVTMRLFNSLVFVLVVGACYALAAPGLRRALVVGVGATLVPLAAFMIASINPGSWAFTSAATTLVAAVVHMTARGTRRVLLSGALLTLTVFLGAGARGDAGLFAAVSIGAAFLITLRLERGWFLRAVYPTAIALVATALFFNTGQTSTGPQDGGGSFEPGRLFNTAMNVPDLWVGTFGRWAMGWVDIPVVAMVWVIAFGLYATLVVTGIRGIGRLHGLAVAGMAFALWVVPTYAQYNTGAPVGSFVQPRYVLPLVVMLVMTVLVRLDRPWPVISRGQRWFVVGALGFANALALHGTLQRFVWGIDVTGLNLNVATEWWWPWGVVPSPMVLWVLGSAVFVALLAVATKPLTEPAVVAVAAEPAGPAEPAPAAEPAAPAGPARPAEPVGPAPSGEVAPTRED